MTRSRTSTPSSTTDAFSNESLATIPSADIVFAQAFQLHQQGQLERAKALYGDVLNKLPQHFDALNLLGAIAVQVGDYSTAISYINKALALRPADGMAHSNKGIALNALGQWAEAEASYRKSIELQPESAIAHFNLGTVLAGCERNQEALLCYERAIDLNPRYADAYLSRGAALGALERFDEAIASVENAIELNPNCAEAYSNLGVLYKKKGYWQQAIACYGKAIQLKPEFVEACVNMANVFLKLKQFDAVVGCVEHALRLKPDYVEALSLKGSALHFKGQFSDAVACFESALALRPNYSMAHYNRGVSLESQLQLEEALLCYDRAIQYDEAFADAHGRKAVVLLLSGRFEEGWEEYEWRWKTAEAKGHERSFEKTLWNGQTALQGKTILLHSEQGYGDTIQFCRYAALAKAQGATVILEVPGGLMSLLANVEGVDHIVCKGEKVPTFDLHCPLLSLPRAFKTKLHTIPSSKAYLRSEPIKRKKWEQRIGPSTKLRVGLVWSGNPHHLNDANRSLPLRQFLNCLPSECEYVCIQKVASEEDRCLMHQAGLSFYGDELEDFSDTAALCDVLDVVVSIDTSVAHLAAALGKPVWILLPHIPDWRWLLECDYSPWYPSARLYRQDAERKWESVLSKVSSDLIELQRCVNSLDHIGGVFEQGFRFQRNGQFNAAKECYARVLMKNAWHDGALNLMGAIALQEKQFSTALSWISKALMINPEWAVPHMNRGVALSALGQLDLSLQSYDRAIQLDAHNPDVWYNRGTVLNLMRRYPEAIASYDQAIRLRPEFAAAYCNRGNALMRAGYLDAAVNSYDKAIEVQPTYDQAHRGRRAALLSKAEINKSDKT